MLKWVSAFGLSNNGDGECSIVAAAYRQIWGKGQLVWSKGQQLPGTHAALANMNQGELSQWHLLRDSTINTVVAISIIIIINNVYSAANMAMRLREFTRLIRQM